MPAVDLEELDLKANPGSFSTYDMEIQNKGVDPKELE